jgi:hypothetical protein
MSHAPSRDANDSATISVDPSGVTAMPFGKATPSATRRLPPSGVTRATTPDLDPTSKSKPWLMSKLGEFT